jgi:glycosyltransferase involved in cell wall biosynthesis
MTIGIYGRGLANRAGIGRYTRELLRALLAASTPHRFRVFVGEGPAAEYDALLGDAAVVLRGSGDRLSEEQIALPIKMRRESLDLFHNPDFTLPVCAPARLPSVVTVHDLAYLRLPESNSVKSKVLLSALVPRSIRCASAIIAVSEFTKREIVDVYRIPPEKIHVIPNGIEERFSPPPPSEMEEVRARYGLPDEGVVLYLGGIEPRKNVERLAEAVARIPGAVLAIAGGRNRNAEAILSRVEAVLGDRARLLGFVPDGDLPALYGAASLFAYPSLYEGFGIPPVEAMACGTPVVASNAASLPEAVGDAASLVDPHSKEEIANAISSLLSDPGLRRARAEAGLIQSAKFRWPDVANRTLALYQQVANGSPARAL